MSSKPSVQRPAPARAANLPAAEAAPTRCFAVHAAVDPGVMARVMELFAKRSLVPSRWHSDLVSFAGAGRPAELVIDIQVSGLSADESDYIARCLRQQVHVLSVLTSVKEAAPAARIA